MSVVAVKIDKEKIQLSSDSFIGGQYQQSKIKFVKSFDVNGLTVGGAGTAEELSLLKIFCANHTPKASTEDAVVDFMVEFFEWVKKKNSNFKPENNYLIIYKKKVYLVSELYVREIKDYFAVGAGKFHAQAVMHMGHSAQDAVKVACELSPWCEEPINTFEIKL